MTKNLVLLLTTCSLLLTTVPPAYATFDLADVFKLNQTQTVATTFSTPSAMFDAILPNLFIIAGLILMFIIIGSGLTMISSGGNPEAKEKGKAGLKGAIIGFVIIFTSYWIIQIIQVLTGVQILNSTWMP